MGFVAEAAAPTTTGAPQRNGFVAEEQRQAEAPTAADRVQAFNSGMRQGGAYLATLPADFLLNVKGLGQAAGGYVASQFNGGHIPAWADPENDPTLRPNAAGAAVTGLMDQSPTFTTQANRPDDVVSRYLHTTGAVVPGALAAGGGGIGSTARALATGTIGASGAQAVHDLHPFSNDSAQTAAEALVGMAGSGAANKVRGGRPLANEINEGVDAAKRQGLSVPSYATNPNPATSIVSRVAKYGTVLDKAEEHNQPITNATARSALGLEENNNPIPTGQIADIRKTENANYQAAGNYQRPILKDQTYYDQIAAARSRLPQGQLAQVLANRKAGRVLDRLSGDQQQAGPNTFDAAGGVSDVGALRDAAYQAGRAGDRNTAAIYHQAADAVEGAMDRSMGADPQASGLVQAWRNARTRLAAAHVVEDSLDERGNVQARKIGDAVADGRVTDPDLRDVGLASNAAAGKGFGVPGEVNPRGGFLGEAMASVLTGGGLEGLHQLSSGEHGGMLGPTLASAGTFAGIKTTQALARAMALRLGQYQREPAPGLANGWVPAGDVGLAASLPR